ncbi:MAG: HlyD family type I secretion periplasmic adaptor subunit, partial [Gammaproteobacteria bacterium]|nr:HlyD family type I secretion periplasmic adaptor subunit [Gammaproteobacteria bacterium]
DEVAAGEIIAELEDIASDAEVEDLRNREASFAIRSRRLAALLLQQDELLLPDALMARAPALAEEALSSFISYRNWYKAILASHQAKIAQREAEIREAEARMDGLELRLELVGEQVAISAEMLEKKLTNEYEHIQLRKEQAQLEADLNTTKATQERLKVAQHEAEVGLEVFLYETEMELRKDQQEASVELTSLRERLRKSSDSRLRTSVRTPVAGTVMTLFMKNRGAVVPPGGTLATLVPEGESLLIEAELPIAEVGYIEIGSPARLSMSGGGSGFSNIDAKVVHISPDAVVDEKSGGSHYVVRLQPEQLYFERTGVRYPLRPGVQVMAAIISGGRSVLAVLIDPFFGAAIKPLTER